MRATKTRKYLSGQEKTGERAGLPEPAVSVDSSAAVVPVEIATLDADTLLPACYPVGALTCNLTVAASTVSYCDLPVHYAGTS